MNVGRSKATNSRCSVIPESGGRQKSALFMVPSYPLWAARLRTARVSVSELRRSWRVTNSPPVDKRGQNVRREGPLRRDPAAEAPGGDRQGGDGAHVSEERHHRQRGRRDRF